MDITKWTREQVIEFLSESKLGGLIPSDFTVDGDSQITFIPPPQFWRAWRRNKSELQHQGCRVYGYYIRKKATKPEDWRCSLDLNLLERR